jgi:hypothetical protein
VTYQAIISSATGKIEPLPRQEYKGAIKYWFLFSWWEVAIA